MSGASRVPQRPLGDTGLTIPCVAFGAGPVSALLTDASARDRQLATLQQALSLGVDWFDTAATYGTGTSESSLGRALRELNATRSVRVGTKVRLTAEQLGNIVGAVRASVEGSLQRLGVGSVALLQLHNSITRRRGDQPTSITPDDVLRSGGVREAFEQLRREGLVQHFGLTGLGDEASLDEVLKAGPWTTMQVNLNLCERSAGLRPGANLNLRPVGRDSVEPHSEHSEASGASISITPPGRDARFARADSVGQWGSTESCPTSPALLAIRVFAGGALAGKPPSAHTLTTKFFPLPIYERDSRRAAAMRALLPAATSLPEVAVRFAAHHPAITSAIIGFGSSEEVTDAVRWAANGPLPDELIATLTAAGV